MKHLSSVAFFAAITFCLSSVAVADNIVETYTCKVEEGKTMKDVQAKNSEWLKWVNAKVEGGGITSAVGTAVVGSTNSFIFVDTYPNLATWAAAKDALDSEAGEELGELFEGISDCSENRLWKIEDTK